MKLENLIKFALLLLWVTLITSVIVSPTLPQNVVNSLNSLYPLSQNKSIQFADTVIFTISFLALFLGSILIFFNHFSISKWMILFALISSELSVFIETPDLAYGLSLFLKEILDMLQGVVLILLFIPSLFSKNENPLLDQCNEFGSGQRRIKGVFKNKTFQIVSIVIMSVVLFSVGVDFTASTPLKIMGYSLMSHFSIFYIFLPALLCMRLLKISGYNKLLITPPLLAIIWSIYSIINHVNYAHSSSPVETVIATVTYKGLHHGRYSHGAYAHIDIPPDKYLDINSDDIDYTVFLSTGEKKEINGHSIYQTLNVGDHVEVKIKKGWLWQAYALELIMHKGNEVARIPFY